MPLTSPKPRLAKLTRPAFFAVLTLLALTAAAQSPNAHIPTDATSLGQRIELPNTWLFSPTDNPANASPALDDSAWTSISTDKPLTSFGFRYYRYAWYRTHIHIRPDARNIAVETTRLQGRYEVFVNGQGIGTFGNLSDHTYTDQLKLASFSVPNSLLAQANGQIVLAFRFAVIPYGESGPGTSIPMQSIASVALAAQSDVASDATVSFSTSYGINVLIATLALIVGLVALALFLSIRSQREYLALAVFLIQPAALLSLVALAGHFEPVPLGLDTYLLALVSGIVSVALLEFIRLVLAMPRNRWLVAFEYLLLVSQLFGPLTYDRLFPQYVGFALYILPGVALLFLLPTLLIRHWNRSRDARLLLPAVFLTGINVYFASFWWICFVLHLTRRTPPRLVIHLGIYTLSLSQIGDILFALGMLFFILLRTVRISRARANLSAEIAAAATVQQLLLDRSSQPTPGFLVDSVFLPASSLGGDFFLVTTHPFDGSLICVVGDVSGKGLTAAMRVAMILGCLRRETSHHPGDILASLNDAILAQGELGFTTALCVRLFLNGDFILANAGHIPPYIANSQTTGANATAREFDTPPALPLGIAPGEVYHLQKGQLVPSERLVLMSDGVPEARSHSGELYGFDRLQHLTLLSAHDIAATAQRFGQEDDITVLTLTLAP
jgi:sigma-B regulation protein RsbU (phosphoserine phosphatase)